MAQDQEQLMRDAFKFQSSLEAYANAILHDWTLSKDAVQEAFIRASVKWQEIDEDRLFNWLKKVTRDKAKDLIRREQKHSRIKTALDDIVDRHFDVHLTKKLHEKNMARTKVIEGCMGQLRPEALKVMSGFYKERESCETIADKMNRSVNAIRILLHRTRDTVRKCVKTQVALNE
ncbi:MAG: sigma-70 family RNA polymerase sigma factor [Lentisphaeraceae bacterium]|nr:sigma-70 family RNA polymerase sigma factor [Lentisphaeraceae bacterium]